MFIEKVFIAMGQSQEVADLAATYVKIVAPGVITYIWGCAIEEWCCCQGKPKYVLYSTAGASIIHWPLAYYLAVNC
jgi:Na+-driven multidrug efflux pump